VIRPGDDGSMWLDTSGNRLDEDGALFTLLEISGCQ